jgi:hypothetical protein
MLKIKKSARRLSLRKRYLAMTASEKSKSKLLLSNINNLIQILSNDGIESDVKTRGIHLILLHYAAYLGTIQEADIPLEPCINYRRTIDSFTHSECWNFFETRKEDLPRLLHLLLIPEIVTLENRSSMPGEEVLLRGLYEFVSGADQNEIAYVFGRDATQQSRAFKWFVDQIYDNFQDLVMDNLDWWYNHGYLHQSKEAIKVKMNGNENFTTCGFIDCNCLECSRPGGGPIEEGSDAARWDPKIQQAFYNGWKSVHGLKHQTFDCAFGMTVDLYGPHSLRRNDLMLLTSSRLNSRETKMKSAYTLFCLKRETNK